MPRGFIFQATYRVEAGRPVVHLYGTLESGASFLIRDSRQVPHFWIREREATQAAEHGARIVADAAARRSMRGEPLVQVDVTLPADAPTLRERLIASDIPCFEADVRFASRYLIDRGIRGSLAVRGDARREGGIGAVFENPEVGPAAWTPTLSVLSFDIETDYTSSQVLSIALYGAGAAEVLLLTPPGASCPPSACACPDERELLRAFVRRVREIDPDVLTGWNVIDFDLAVLEARAHRLGVPLTIGRSDDPPHLRPSSAPRRTRDAFVAGRLVLDGIDLLRGAFIKLDDYSLNGAARAILGKQKTITGSNRAAEILHAFEHDRSHLVEYNLNDARLVLEILERLRLVELSVQRSLLTGLPPDRVAGSISAFDSLYLTELSRRGMAAPSVRTAETPMTPTGGHVLDPAPGLYRNAIVLDFKSLYPTIIRTFQIDPLGHLAASGDDDPIYAPNGVAFARRPGILPSLLDRLMPRRAEVKAAGDEVASYAIKILMNSFAGVLGSPACRFASHDLVNAITGFGREILLWSRRRIEDGGHRVLYGDTDSLFVLSDEADPQAARALGRRLADDVNAALARHITETWRVESRLEIEFEKLYLRLLLPHIRHGTAGARKRYAGLLERDGATEVEFIGMEVVRRDWTALAKRVQRELYDRLFHDRPLESFLRQVVADVREGRLDDELVYRKGLRRRLETYTASTPPHVAAARKMRGRPGRVIRYVITRDGPEPVAERRSPIDHEHYVQKQVRAVAEPVLEILGLDFDRVIGDERQMRLF